MASKIQFREAAKTAVQNIIKHGDTDIFPFPFENHAFFDNRDGIVDLIVEYDENFEDYLARYSPRNVSSLTPVTYWGFRWATQIDSIWNAHFLACVLAIAQKIEDARIPKEKNIVFSYRYKPDKEAGDLFDRDFGWVQFMERSAQFSSEFEFVVACDISEFYPRLGYHRLENALEQVAGSTAYPKKIMEFLTNYSINRSFGLPIGGPAARILSEITINQIDRLLVGNEIPFARFLAHANSTDCQSLLQQLYEERTSPIIRRDIILALAKFGDWYWISDLKNRFRELSGPERRAFLVASYILKDEGDHWRKHIREELNPYELFVLKWAGEKAGQKDWGIPL